ncbi:MAG: agmatine deiminase family protein [bacterium]|nr:agmatine deiminase family protein [bacterium]
MITNQNTNFVYFSEKILDNQYKDAYARIKAILDKNSIESGLLKGTKDVWCRDYMPIQLSKDKFVQFRYDPSYLKNFTHLKTKPRVVHIAHNLDPIVSNINLDGGNVVQWEDKVVISARVYKENPEYADKFILRKELEKLFESEVIIIPEIESDLTGHADGMVRFLNGKALIGNSRELEFEYWSARMNRVLETHDLFYADIPFMLQYKDRMNPETAIGCYVNFLEVGNLIVLPIFEVPGNHDEEVLALFKIYYPKRIIETVNINEVANQGGLLNCITWTILK